jgi:hypothetical protein
MDHHFHLRARRQLQRLRETHHRCRRHVAPPGPAIRAPTGLQLAINEECHRATEPLDFLRGIGFRLGGTRAPFLRFGMWRHGEIRGRLHQLQILVVFRAGFQQAHLQIF